jgi:ligand-binding SRPBCC domain-containing protein
MFIVNDSIHIHAPAERCFLLSTSVALKQETLGLTPVAGKIDGLIAAGDRVVWAGWKFGLPQRYESIVTSYEQPAFLQETMGYGRFKRFQHDHKFAEVDGHTLLVSKVRFSVRFWKVGRVFARRVIIPHLSELLRQRLMNMKRVAEGTDWQRYIPEKTV